MRLCLLPRSYQPCNEIKNNKRSIVGGCCFAKGKPFGVDMIRPFVRSTIWYNYTKMTSACPTERPAQVACDQAYSVSVAAFNCTDDKSERRLQRLRRRRKKKNLRLAAMVAAAAAAATAAEVNLPGVGDEGSSTNSVWSQSQADDDAAAVGPLSAIDGRQPFVVPADQLSLLYTVPHEVSSSTSVAEKAAPSSISDGTPGTAGMAASTVEASSTVMAAAPIDSPTKPVEEESPDYDVDR